MAHDAANPAPTAQSGPNILNDASWFDANWMWFSTGFFVVSLFLICFRFSGSIRQKLDNPYVIGWLGATFYFIHQTEEHGYDLRGWRYAFVPSFNHVLGPILFPDCEQYVTCPLDPLVTTGINVTAIWFGFVLTMVCAHYLGPKYAYAGYFNWGMSIVNAFGGHLLPWVLTGYNPGALQSFFQFSFGVWAISRCGPKFAAVCIANGILFHAICFGVGIKVLMKLGLPLILDIVPCFLMTSMVPLLLARWVPIPPRDSDSSSDSDTDSSSKSETA